VIKPPPGLALIRFLDGFNVDMAYQLRETNAATLEEMKRNVVSVEAIFLAKRAKLKDQTRVTIKEEPSSSSSDAKLDTLVKTMERMMERISLTNRTPPRETKGGTQIRNPNFSKNPPQINQWEKIGPTDQQQNIPPL